MAEFTDFSSNDTKVFSDKVFKVYQELLNESILIDPTNSIPVVSKSTNAVHKGEMFSINAEGILPAGESMYLLGVTADKEVHFNLFHVDTNQGNFKMELFESPTVTNVGGLISSLNRKRSSSNVATMLTYGGTVVTDGGILLDATQVFDTGGTGNHVIRGYGELGADWLLKTNTNYLIKFTNSDITDLNYSGTFIWAEKEPII